MISSSVKNRSMLGKIGRRDDNDDAAAKNYVGRQPGAIEPPATAEMSGYPCLVECAFLRSRWRVNAPGARLESSWNVMALPSGIEPLSPP